MRVDSSIMVSGLCVKPSPNEWTVTLFLLVLDCENKAQTTKKKNVLCSLGPLHHKVDAF